MQNWQYFVLFAVSGLGLACCLAVFYVVYRYFMAAQLQLAQLGLRMAALETARAGAQRFSSSGVQAQVQYSMRRQTAIMEALALFKTGQKPMDILIAIAQKYPDVAVQMAQNPDVILQDVKRMGLVVPPEFLASLGQNPPPKPPPEAV